MGYWPRFGSILLSLVMLSAAAGAEPALHGIPYKPDPPPAVDGRLDEWESVPNAYIIQTREQVIHERCTLPQSRERQGAP